MPERPLRMMLEDILDQIDEVETTLQGLTETKFLTSSLHMRATRYSLQTIGEIARALPADFKTAHPEVEWEKMKGLRNRAAHQYWDVDDSILWNIYKQHLPITRRQIQTLLDNLTP